MQVWSGNQEAHQVGLSPGRRQGFQWFTLQPCQEGMEGQDGKTYMAPHERLAGRKRKSADGREEFASKALGNYPAKFCKALAENIARVETERAREARGPPEVRA